MAKAAADKPSKVSKKKSPQGLNVDAPTKTKKTKQTEGEPVPAPVDPSSSNHKKEKKERKKKKATDAVKEVVEEAEAPVATGKKDKKGKDAEKATAREDVAHEVEGKETEAVGKKGKRMANDVEDNGAGVVKESKKKRKDTAAAAAAAEVKQAAPSPRTKKSPAKPALKEQKKSKVETEEKAEEGKMAKEEKKTNEKRAKTKSTKVAEPEPEPEAAEDAEENEASEQEEQEFYGFESDDDDSSDEEMVDDIPSIDIGKLPTIAKDDATVKRKLEKAKRKPTEDRGVLSLSRIPHGFYEDQMRAYFSQFGNVTRLRLSRNKKTGKPKHYGFIEFESSSVAGIVAETMDNYLLMGHILRCKMIPKDQVHPELWVGANRKWRAVPRDRVARVAHNKPRTEEELEKAEARLLKRQEQRKRKLEETGIKYDFEAVAYKKKRKPIEA